MHDVRHGHDSAYLSLNRAMAHVAALVQMRCMMPMLGREAAASQLGVYVARIHLLACGEYDTFLCATIPPN